MEIDQVKFIIPTAPRTKKNHSRIFRMKKTKAIRIMPSKQWETFCENALVFLKLQITKSKIQPINFPVNCKAVFYRDRENGDAVGYYQGLADVLEVAKVVENDKWIVSWDGSKLQKDIKNPRIEIEIARIKKEL